MTPIVLVCEHEKLNEAALAIATSLGLDCVTHIPKDADLILALNPDGLSLLRPQDKKMGALTVSFTDGALTWRRNHGGGTGQAIAKAIGLKSKKNISVLDATAGTGTDSFVLAALGCQVQMIERHPIVAALLQDALERAEQDADVHDITQNMSLHTGSAVAYMKALKADSFDVVYLDPMFPHSGKNAQVKKSMQYFRDMVGKDEDADDLLEPALNAAKYRVVVKRPRKSPYLMDHKPTLSHEGKANRFDIYVNQGMK